MVRTTRNGRVVSAVVSALALSAATMVTIGVTAVPAAASGAPDPVTAAQASRIVSKYEGVWSSPPAIFYHPYGANNEETTDGPLMGNGDLAAVLGGTGDALTAYLGKSDFWWYAYHTPMSLARLQVLTPGMAGASYQVRQNIAQAEVDGTFVKTGAALDTSSWVAATDNVYVTTLRLTGGTAQTVSVRVLNGQGGTPPAAITGASGDVLTVDVASDRDATDAGNLPSPSLLNPVARIATRVVGATATVLANTLTFTAQPGVSYSVVSAMLTNSDTGAITSSDFKTAAVSKVQALTNSADVEALRTAHRDWWSTYWSKSFVEIPDKAVERSWYGSQYIMGSTSRKGEQAPGLFGNWTTGIMAWFGDYHLNYNHQLPYYASIVSNHLDQAAPQDRPVLDYDASGKALAQGGDIVPYSSYGSFPEALKFGFEQNDRPLSWTDTLDVPAVNVTSTSAAPSSTQKHTGTTALKYSGTAVSGSAHTAYSKLLDINGVQIAGSKITVDADTTLSYWIYPENGNGTCVALDVVFTDGTKMRDSGSFDQAGHLATPSGQCNNLILNTWNQVTVNLGTKNLGKDIDRVLVGYDQAAGSGAFNGYVDDISLNGFPRDGVLYPVGIGPNGTVSALTTLGQKSDAALAAAPMIAQFYASYDPTYANSVYSFLKDVAKFWQGYLTEDPDGSYDIYGDGMIETDTPGKNSALSLGLVRYLMQGLVDISTFLGQDASLRSTWNDILAHLAPLPIINATVNGVSKPVLSSYQAYNGVSAGSNRVVHQIVSVASQLGLDSDPALLTAAKNTLDEWPDLWHNQNSPTWIYSAAARIGYDPDAILSNLHTEVTAYQFNNLAVTHIGGGLENTNVVSSGLAEMLLQSHQDDIKVFADWPANKDAKFGDLRAKGAYLVSSSMRANAVEYVRVISEQGRPLALRNPWPGQSVQVWKNGTLSTTTSAAEINVTTAPGDVLHFAPNGVSLATVQNQLTQPVVAKPNLALARTAQQSSVFSPPGWGPALAVDGNTNGNAAQGSVTATNGTDASWWQVDLASSQPIGSIGVFNRTDAVPERLSNYWVFVSDSPFDTSLSPTVQAAKPGVWSNHQTTQAGSPTTIPVSATGRYVMIQLNSPGYLSLAEVEVYGADNLAAGQPATQSSNYGANTGPGLAVDGNLDGNFTHSTVTTTNGTGASWWQVDLGSSKRVGAVAVFNRTDAVPERLSNYWVFVSDSPFDTSLSPTAQAAKPGVWSNHQTTQAGSPTTIQANATGRYVMVQLNTPGYLSLAEVEIHGATDLAASRLATQSSNFSSQTGPGLAVDGNLDGNAFHYTVSTTNGSDASWWQVDLGSSQQIGSIAVYNRTDAVPERLSDYWVFVSSSPFDTTKSPLAQAAVSGIWYRHQTSQAGSPTTIPATVNGRYVMVQLTTPGYLTLAEVHVNRY